MSENQNQNLIDHLEQVAKSMQWLVVERLEMDESTGRNWLAGKSISRPNKKRLCEELGVEVEQLFPTRPAAPASRALSKAFKRRAFAETLRTSEDVATAKVLDQLRALPSLAEDVLFQAGVWIRIPLTRGRTTIDSWTDTGERLAHVTPAAEEPLSQVLERLSAAGVRSKTHSHALPIDQGLAGASIAGLFALGAKLAEYGLELPDDLPDLGHGVDDLTIHYNGLHARCSDSFAYFANGLAAFRGEVDFHVGHGPTRKAMDEAIQTRCQPGLPTGPTAEDVSHGFSNASAVEAILAKTSQVRRA